MPDNWGFVIAAYALAAVVLGGYWRFLARRERDLLTLAATRRRTAATTDRPDPEAVRDDPTSRSRQLSRPAQ
jgi:hypothetical protein